MREEGREEEEEGERERDLAESLAGRARPGRVHLDETPVHLLPDRAREADGESQAGGREGEGVEGWQEGEGEGEGGRQAGRQGERERRREGEGEREEGEERGRDRG
eukprot:2377966-Rhodomonas_salina.1